MLFTRSLLKATINTTNQLNIRNVIESNEEIVGMHRHNQDSDSTTNTLPMEDIEGCQTQIALLISFQESDSTISFFPGIR
jgi:hypothetical protein